MVNLNVSLTETQRDWVEAQVKAGRYGNLSEYIRALIRVDQSRAAEQRLQELLLEGLDSGPSTEVTKEFWADVRREALARAREIKLPKRKAG